MEKKENRVQHNVKSKQADNHMITSMPRQHEDAPKKPSSQNRQYIHKLEALYEHAALLAKTTTLADASHITLDAMKRILGFDFLSFLIMVNDVLIEVNSEGAPILALRLPINGKGIVARAARTKKPQLVPDTRLDADYLTGSTNSLSELDIPVVLDGDVVAVINAESLKPNAFNAEDVVLCQLLANNVASAIQRIRSREKLNDAETLTKALINEIGDGVFITDLEDHLIDINQAVIQILGYTREELLHMNFSRLLSTKDSAILKQHQTSLLKNGRGVFEVDAIAKDGTIIPSEVSASFIMYRGKPAVVGISRDLRERRKLQTTLRETAELHQNILDNSPIPISITVNGKIVYANKSRVELTGASSLEELLDQQGPSFIHPDDASLIVSRVKTYAGGKTPPEKYNFRLLKSDGSYADIDANSTPIIYQGENAMLHILHDITQSKEYEERLTSLHGYAHDLSSTETIDEAARVVGEVAHRWLKSSHGSVGVVEGDLLRYRYVYGVNWVIGGALPIDGPGITTRAVRTGKTQLIRDVSSDPDFFVIETSDVATGSALMT